MEKTDIMDNKSVTPSFEDGTELTAEQKLYLWTLVSTDPTVPSSSILEQDVSINITIRHLSTWP